MSLKGFFAGGSEGSSTKITLYGSPYCRACKLDKGCNSPKMKVDGEGQRKILICGEAPGEREDEEGIPFVGKTGQYLESVLGDFGIDMRRDCWITNALVCRPPGNAAPTDKQINWCRPHITSDNNDSKGNKVGLIHRLQPETIILLGGAAVKSIIGWLWKEDTGGVNRWVGWNVPCQKLNSWLCPTWHPSFVVRERGNKNPNRAVELKWRQHLQEAVSHRGRPWKQVPDYKSRVIVELIPRKAAEVIREIIKMGIPAAFDYETDGLKPDRSDAWIRTCAISNGAITIAYPMEAEAKRATQEFVQSSLPKVASNLKFEERWTMRYFGHGVKNWVLDTMQAAHILDNRSEITSIKFQAFVLLGQPGWEEGVKPYFESGGPNKKNRIKDVDLRTLLAYNGLDSLCELEVAKIQAEQLGMEL